MNGRTCIHGTSLQWFCMNCGGKKRTVADRGTGLGDELAALTDENKRLKHLLHVAGIDLNDSKERVERRDLDLSAMHDYAGSLRARLALADALAEVIRIYGLDPTSYRWGDVRAALTAYDLARAGEGGK